MNDALRRFLDELERFGRQHDARTSAHHERMLNITRDTGELLAILVQGMKARRILEVGTSNGYSTLWLADAAKAVAGKVVTIDISQAKADMARRNLEHARLSPWVHQEVMDFDDYVGEAQPTHFDLVFLDVPRDRYVAWWPWLRQVLVPGGLLVVDNAISHSWDMKGLIAEVKATPGWLGVVVPVGKGEFVAVKPVNVGGVADTRVTTSREKIQA